MMRWVMCCCRLCCKLTNGEMDCYADAPMYSKAKAYYNMRV